MSVSSVRLEPFVCRMLPGARPPPLDAARSSLYLCLIVVLLCVAAAVSEGDVYSGESGFSSHGYCQTQHLLIYSLRFSREAAMA